MILSSHRRSQSTCRSSSLVYKVWKIEKYQYRPLPGRTQYLVGGMGSWTIVLPCGDCVGILIWSFPPWVILGTSLPLSEPQSPQRRHSSLTGQWLANFRLHRNHLEVFVKHRLLSPRVSDSVGLGEAWEFAFLTSSQGDHTLRATFMQGGADYTS